MQLRILTYELRLFKYPKPNFLHMLINLELCQMHYRATPGPLRFPAGSIHWALASFMCLCRHLPQAALTPAGFGSLFPSHLGEDVIFWDGSFCMRTLY